MSQTTGRLTSEQQSWHSSFACASSLQDKDNSRLPMLRGSRLKCVTCRNSWQQRQDESELCSKFESASAEHSMP